MLPSHIDKKLSKEQRKKNLKFQKKRYFNATNGYADHLEYEEAEKSLVFFNKQRVIKDESSK